MKNDVPKLFGGVPTNKLKETSQQILSSVCTVIAQHKGSWSNSEVEKLATDTYSYFMQRVIDDAIIVRIKEKTNE